MRACVHACMCACVHVCMRACVHACMCACVHVCMRACVHACMCACVHVCMHACVHACMCACVHVCMRACVHACMCACVHVCMRACVCLQHVETHVLLWEHVDMQRHVLWSKDMSFLQLIANGSPDDKLMAFFAAIEWQLGVKGSGIDVRGIVEGRGDDAIRQYLEECMLAWQQMRSQRREDQPLKREDQPLRREDQPLRREDQPLKREDQPLRREDQPLKRENQPLMMAVRATVKRLSVPVSAEAVMPLPLNSSSQKRRSAEKPLPLATLPLQATPTIPSINTTPAVEDTPSLQATPTKQMPDKIAQSQGMTLPNQQLHSPAHVSSNTTERARRVHSDASPTGDVQLLPPDSNGFMLSKDYELGHLPSALGHLPSSALPSAPASTKELGGSAAHLASSKNNQSVHLSSDSTRGVRSPSNSTRGVHSPSDSTRGVCSPSNSTRGVHSPSDSTRGVHSPSDSTRDILASDPKPLNSYPDSSLPRSQLDGNDMGSDHIPYSGSHGEFAPSRSHSNLTTDSNRTNRVSPVPSPSAYFDRELSSNTAPSSHATNFSTLPERSKQSTEEQLFPMARRTVSSPESLAPPEGTGSATSLGSPSKSSKTHLSHLKRSQSQLASAGSKIRTSTVFQDRPQRASSVTTLNYSSEVPSKIDDLHERVTMLAAVLDSERQSLLKHLNDKGIYFLHMCMYTCYVYVCTYVLYACTHVCMYVICVHV